MKRIITIGMVSLVVFTLLNACSENDEWSEHYTGTFLEIVPGGSIQDSEFSFNPDDASRFFKQQLGVEFEEETSISKEERVTKECWQHPETEKTYDLVIRESEADLYIQTKKDTTNIYTHEEYYVYEYKYTFKPGIYRNGWIEVKENAILDTYAGSILMELEDFTTTFREIREREILEQYKKTDTAVEIYQGVFSCKRDEEKIVLSNSDYTFEVVLNGNECELTELSPEYEYIGTLDKQ